MAGRRVGKRKPIKMNGTFRETGFSSEAAIAVGNAQVDGVEREIARQDAATNEVLGRSNRAREALVEKGLFGGLN